MTEAIRAWLMALCGTAAVCTLAMCACPEGRVKRILRLVCGAAMAIALLSPLADFDLDAYSRAAAKYGEAARAAAGEGTAVQDRLSRTIIEDECAAYILDKADALDIVDVSVDITAEWNGANGWLPVGARLSGDCTAEQRARLAELLETELGIPPKRQEWRGDG
ncbi:MAG: hypothetical protein RR230_02720 [Oscillospiraceae bacterium]